MSTAIIRRVGMALLAGLLVAGGAEAARQDHADQRAASQAGATRVPASAKWWQDERVKADLHLTPDQCARINDVFEGFVANMSDVARDIRQREDKLSHLISADDVTEAQLLKEVDQLETQRSTLAKARTLMLFRMRRVLSPEQRGRLVEIQKAREQERRSGRAPEHGPIQ